MEGNPILLKPSRNKKTDNRLFIFIGLFIYIKLFIYIYLYFWTIRVSQNLQND